MAVILNKFKTVTKVLTTGNQNLYTPDAGYTGIILMAQVSNITSSASTATVSYYDNVTYTSLIQGFSIPANDSTSATTGKLVVPYGSSVWAQAGANSTMHITLSILETFNG